MGLNHLYMFLVSLPVGATFWIFLSVGLIAQAFYPRTLRLFEFKLFWVPVYLCAAMVCLQYLFWTAGYLFIPKYFDHAEPAIAIISELLLRSQQIYPSWSDGEGLYGMIYGPILYFIHGGLLLVSKNILSTKLAGVLAIWVALVILVLEIRKSTGSKHTMFMAFSCVILFFSYFGYYTFWNRPEPFLILLSAISLRAVRFSPYRCALFLGLLTGLSVGLKPYAAMFFVPLVIYMVAREKNVSMSIRLGILTGAIAVGVAVIPFLFPMISLSGYIQYLGIASHHRFSLDSLYESAVHVLMITAPLVIIYFFRRPSLSREFLWMIRALFASMLVVAVLSSKEGAGAYYLLPFIPLALYLALQVSDMEADRTGLWKNRSVAALCLFLLYLINLGPSVRAEGFNINRILLDSTHERMLLSELNEIYKAYPMAEMGASDDENYGPTFYGVLGVLKGGAVHLGITYLMDLSAVGIGQRESEEINKQCKVQAWIIPAEGTPFSLSNFYKRLEKEPRLFSARFRELFYQNYKIVFEGNYFNVWDCRR